MKTKRAAAFLFMTAAIRGYRVVVIHGKGNSGDSYRQRLQPLITAPQFQHVEWVFPTAPYRMRDGHEEFEWWRLPKGERSFTALSYDGAEESIKQIESMTDVDALQNGVRMVVLPLQWFSVLVEWIEILFLAMNPSSSNYCMFIFSPTMIGWKPLFISSLMLIRFL